MKKSLLLIILVISGFIGFAQLEVKEGSFKKVDGFVNINIEKMYDDNDKPYAVLKIKTENINDKQRRELGFGGDAQTFFEVEYKDGEVWLYISYYATFLKISHPDLSSTEFWFPYDMEPKRGYELTLVNKPAIDEEIISRIEKLENSKSEVAANSDDYGYIVVKTGSLEGATVYIDGQEMEMKTPFVSDPIKKGPHKIRVVKDGYEAYSDIVAVEGNGMKTVNVDLKKEKTTNQYRKKGFVFIPEFCLGREYIRKTGFAFMPMINIDYFITPHFSLGAGSGFMYFNESKLSAIPLYGQFSWYFSKRTTSPFINIKIGHLFGTKDNTVDDNWSKETVHLTGIQISAAVGVNINRSRIEIFYGFYKGKKTEYYYESDYNFYSDYDYYTLGIAYSYLIPFGKNK